MPATFFSAIPGKAWIPACSNLDSNRRGPGKNLSWPETISRSRKSSHSIELAPPASNQDFGRIICNAFDLGDEAQAWLAELPVHPNWKLFLALIDGQVAGVGGLYIEGNLAWLDFGATAPEFRCRGCQSALLSARLEYAFANGCERAFTCTGVDVAGDPQHSYKNILKAGFRPSVVRENYSAD